MKSSAYSSLDRFLEEHILCMYYKKPKASPILFRRGLGIFLSVPYEGESSPCFPFTACLSVHQVNVSSQGAVSE